MTKMHEILEKCLVEIEQGADVDTVLFRYPEFANELRPILETAIKAMDLAVPGPSLAMTHINRIKILQHAAELREAKAKRTSRFWFASLRRVAVTFIVLIALFASGNGLVRASSNTIPGDNLYPVKRTWEDVVVLFTFNVQQRTDLEFKQENERLDEVNELFTQRRSETVDFSGYVTSQNGNEWRVYAISVLISPQTILPTTPVTVGAGVRVIGITQSDGTVLAESIALLPAGAKLPDVMDNESESQEENQEGQIPQVDDNSGSGSENEAPQIEGTNAPEGGSDSQEIENESESGATATPQIVSTPQATKTQNVNYEIKDVSFSGVLQSFSKNTWIVGSRSFNVSNAEINGIPVIGAYVSVEAYYDSSGALIAKHVEVRSGSTDSSSKTSTQESEEEKKD